MGGPSSVKTTSADMVVDRPRTYLSDNFTPAAAFKAWLFTIARNLLIHHLLRR